MGEVTAESIGIYPNPARETVNINWQNDYETLELTDISGKIVFTAAVKGIKEVTVDMASHNDGVYFVKLVNQDRQVIQKLVRN